MTPQELRQKTNAAITRGKEKRQKELERIAAEEARKKRQMELKAEHIIAQIDIKCEREAEQERSFAVVMDMTYDEYKSKNQNPQGAAAIVWDFCRKAGLSPTIEYWHDGVGMKDGHQIVVHW